MRKSISEDQEGKENMLLLRACYLLFLPVKSLKCSIREFVVPLLKTTKLAEVETEVIKY